ncbi:TetR/AcrR family transcriptional regulator [Vibrio ziniensis]|uniref:TetR/AcrR family transcriptional regulator n=1 Tax=Vibrio ziniensis TaxID=2711221 RepID=A0A6G7CQJ0_9VIBR|nr:TetR/AcrR family transcriptional regulator [Vibrio ziniensis]QIH44349.1 TetR/AcrR family transcriptional regulator [Vibrio ziniensis]
MTDKKQGRRSADDAHKTRLHILREATNLFCELGYARVSLRNISEKAGISHSLIRHHFGSKEKIWHHISDGMHHYMELYLRKVLAEIPVDTAVNVKLYQFVMRILAHGLIVKQPIQFIADAVRQEDALIDYFIDTAGELENIVEGLSSQYNNEYPDAPIKVWEIKWQMIMFSHGAASLTPFMKETWIDETSSLDQCLLKQWQLFNDIMVHKLNIAQADIMHPVSVKELVYELCYNWEEECAKKFNNKLS